MLSVDYVANSRHLSAEKQLHELVGPGFVERWTSWKSRTPEQQTRSYIKHELEKILQSDYYKVRVRPLQYFLLVSVMSNRPVRSFETTIF